MEKKSFSCLYILYIIVFITNTELLFAQIGIGTVNPEPSSQLDIFSNTKGFLPPRMTKEQRDDINGGVFAEGLVIYNTDDNCLNFYNGTDWINPCNLSGGTTPPPLPANITLTGGQTAYIASVYDKDYLPYSTPTNVASIGSANVNGALEPTVNVQGTLNTTTGIKIQIPYTVVNGDVDIEAYSQTKTIISEHVQGPVDESNEGGGTPVDVTLSYEAATLSIGTGFIEATLKAVGADFNAVKLDINKGIGTDLGILLAEFSISTNANGDLDTISYRDIAGIPDRQFGQASADGDLQEHDFLYLPVQAEDGKIWLNHNLGANYTDIRNANFNIAAVPTSELDAHAYGSQFQWGRRADGHELNKYEYTTNGLVAVSRNRAFTQTHSHTHSATDNANFLSSERLPWTVDVFHKNNPAQEPSETAAIAQFNWQYPTRWNDQWLANETGGDANPCPEGFRVPSEAEWNAWDANVTPNVLDPWENSLNSALHLTFTGLRGGTEPGSYTTFGSYWSSTFHNRAVSAFNPYGASSTPAMYRLRRDDNPSHPGLYYHSNVEHAVANSWMTQGFTVRCIQSSSSTSPIPSTMQINTDDQIKYIASIDDNDYLPYSLPTSSANQQQSGDGSANDTHINIQGVLTTTGQTFTIPYTSTGSPSYPGYEWTVEVHDSLTQDGQGRTVSFSYPSGAAMSSGSIIVTVKTIGGDLNLKKLDLINGLGNGTSTEGNINSAYGILIAEAPITIDDMGTVKYFQIRNISGIPDRRFGEESTLGNPLVTEQYHNFLYLPVTGEDGKIWLNHNLGAQYSNSNHPSFNIGARPLSVKDFNSYGSSFQWGRYSDGHELAEFTNFNTYEMVHKGPSDEIFVGTAVSSYNPTNLLFVQNGLGNWNTVHTTNDLQWQNENSPNNPCPEGFRLPSWNEFQTLLGNITFSTTVQADENEALRTSALGFTFASARGVGAPAGGYFDSYFGDSGYGMYATSNQSDNGVSTVANNIYINSQTYSPPYTQTTLNNSKAHGNSVRCIQHVEAPTPIPANMTLAGNKVSYIASINDNDYFPYTTPTGPAQLSAKAADGTISTNEPAIDVQGTLTETGQTIKIPYTSSGSPSYDAYSYTVSVHDSLTEDGISRDVNFSYPAGTASSSGSITMTIKSVGGPLNLKKLDLNNGLGDGTSIEGNINSGVYGVFIAEVPIYVDGSNTTEYIQLRNVTGIPDRRFGEQTSQGGSMNYYHNNLYLPIVANSGRTWLNHNLGADYSDVTHDNFNIATRPTSQNDKNAYGSLYQGGRYSDGHELMVYSNSTSGTPLNTPQSGTSGSNSPNSNYFYVINTHNHRSDWRTPQNSALWQGVNGINNPCPEGFRLPSDSEMTTYKTTSSIHSSIDTYNSALGLTETGYRIRQSGHFSSPWFPGALGFYWTSSRENVNGGGFFGRGQAFYPGGTSIPNGQGVENGYGLAIRCILD